MLDRTVDDTLARTMADLMAVGESKVPYPVFHKVKLAYEEIARYAERIKQPFPAKAERPQEVQP